MNDLIVRKADFKDVKEVVAYILKRNYKGFGGNIRTLMKRMFQRGFLRILSAKICAFKEICVVRVPFFEVRQIVNNSVLKCREELYPIVFSP